MTINTFVAEEDSTFQEKQQSINLLAIKTAECDFCGMTFFGAVSLKVRVYIFRFI